MSTSIRQKITLFTLVPAVIFYSLVTAVFLYFSFRAASVEISRRHMEQSLHYAAVIGGNLREIVAGSGTLAAYLGLENDRDFRLLENALTAFFSGNPAVVGAGVLAGDLHGDPHYWQSTSKGARKLLDAAALPSVSETMVDSLLDSEPGRVEWYTSGDIKDPGLFRTSLLVSVALTTKEKSVMRIDIDGAKLIEPLQWQDDRTRLVIFDRLGVTVFANGISLPRVRTLEKFIQSGPCEAYSEIKVTRENPEQVSSFVTSPVITHVGDAPCAFLAEGLRRVTVLGQSINYRFSSRGYRRWVTATPIPSAGWYFSISILEKDILGPVISQAILSASLIALALALSLLSLWAVSGRITRPLNRLKQEMNEYACFDGSEPEDSSRDEARSLALSFSRLVERLGEREKALYLARANNIGHLVQQLRGSYFYFNLDQQGGITHASPSVTAVLGYPVATFQGRMEDYLTPAKINERFSDKLQELMAGHWQEAFEVEMRRRDGAVCRIELFCAVNDESPDPDSVIEGMGNDITHRIHDTEKFKLLIASSPDATLVTNQDGIIAMVNTKVLKLFQYTGDELKNMPLMLLVDAESRDEHPLLKPFNDISPEDHCLDSYLSTGCDSSGRRFPMELSSNVLNTSDGVLFSIVLRDITERKKIEEELISAKVLAEHASQAKSMFLSHISHELRTPLNGVLGYSQLLLSDRDIPERYHENLHSLEECGLHLMTLINDILDMTKIESSGVVVDPQPFALNATLSTVLASIRESARNRQLELRLDVSSDIAPEVIGDNVKIRQVLINLMGNAVKFTPAGSVELRVSRRQDRLCFAVTDTGIGISDEEQTALFKPFSQLKPGQKQGGTGLGLAISFRLVKAMGGELAVTSTPGAGSCFRFSIPYQLPEGDMEACWSIPSHEPVLSLPSNRKRRILVVDDAANNRGLLVNVLSSMGFRVDSVGGGLEAVERCQACQYDLVLMDLKMPQMDGFQATQALRRLPGRKALKVIAVSASVSESTRKHIADHGIQDYIPKPVCFSELQAKIYHCLAVDPETELAQKRVTLTPGITETELDVESARTMVRVVRQCLEIGDIECLVKEARRWQRQKTFGDYPELLVKMCNELDLRSIELLKDELLGMASRP